MGAGKVTVVEVEHDKKARDCDAKSPFSADNALIIVSTSYTEELRTAIEHS